MQTKKCKLTTKQIETFTNQLKAEERSPRTIEKYIRDIRAFSAWLGGRLVSQETEAAWKEYLLKAHYAPVTINSMLAALPGLA